MIKGKILWTRTHRNFSFYMDRILKVSWQQILESMKDEAVLNANTLAVMIKIQNPNSLICKFSLNKLVKVAHTNFKTAKESLETAVKLGLIEIREVKNKKGEVHQDLFVKPFVHKHSRCAILQISDTNTTKAYLYSENNKKNWSAKNSKKVQTFSDVRDLLLEIYLSSKIDSYYNAKNRSQVGGVAESKVKHVQKYMKCADLREHNFVNRLYNKNRPYNEDEVDLSNCGLSLQTLSNWITGGFASRFKISRLIKKMKKAGLIRSRKCASIYLSNDPDHPENIKNPDRVINFMRRGWKMFDNFGDEIDARCRTFMSSRGRHDVLMPLANVYIPTNGVFGWTKITR